jgi:hypothetical protein
MPKTAALPSTVVISQLEFVQTHTPFSQRPAHSVSV